MLFQSIDQVVVAPRVLLVFLIDNLLQFYPNDVPSHIIAVFAVSATDEKFTEGHYSARRLNPLVVDGSTDGCNVNADLIGNLLHLEGFDGFRAFVEKTFLIVDDMLRNFQQRTSSLLNGIDKPLSSVDFLPNKVLSLRSRLGSISRLR